MTTSHLPPNAEFHMYVGFCITAWGKVEEQLFRICAKCLGTSDEIAAIVYYRTPTINARLDLLDELVKARLPRKERKSGGHDHPDVKHWDGVCKDTKSLLGTRSRIAHHPVADRSVFGDPTGIGALGLRTWLEIYMSEHERLRGQSKEVKPLKVVHLSFHCIKVQAITQRLDQFYSNVLSKHVK
jgi:hypothetical protein